MLRPVGFGLVALSTLSSRIAPMLAGSATAAFVAAETWLGVPALRGRAYRLNGLLRIGRGANEVTA